jgi:hypothetical protein
MKNHHRHEATASSRVDPTRAMRQVLALLRQAEVCARQLSEDARQFALGVSRLTNVANITELRSLLHQGYVACLLERPGRRTSPAPSCRCATFASRTPPACC